MLSFSHSGKVACFNITRNSGCLMPTVKRFAFLLFKACEMLMSCCLRRRGS